MNYRKPYESIDRVPQKIQWKWYPMKQRLLLLCLFYLLLTTSIAPALAASEPGWSLQSTASGDWKRTAGSGALSIAKDRLFATLGENDASTWILTTEPVWVNRYPILKLRFRARGIVNGASQPLLILQPGSIGPVTPGAANLENPFARSGSLPLPIPAEYLNDGQEHEMAIRSHPPIRTEQIDQIILSLRSGAQPASLEIVEFSFREEDDKSQPVLSLENLQESRQFAVRDGLSPFLLPEGNVAIRDVAAHDAAPFAQCAGLPFQRHESQRILATPMESRGAITLDIHQSCREVFLLMACDLAGTDNAFAFQPRTRITQPERLIVKLKYDDGTEDRAFPYNLNRSDFVVDASAACCYAIPADPRKTLETVRVEEYMSYGRIFLMGVTLNSSAAALAKYPSIRYPRSLPTLEASSGIQPATLTVDSDRYIRIENHYYRIELDAQNGCRVTKLVLKPGEREILRQPCPLFTLQAGGLRIAPEQMQFETYRANGTSLELGYAIPLDGNPVKARLTIQPATNSECAFSLRLENTGQRQQAIRLRFPSLSGLRISENIEDDFYLFPRSRAAWGNAQAVLSGVHSGEFPLQFMDVYSESRNGGVALHTRDAKLVLKQFLFEKDGNESRMGVNYGFERAIDLQPQTAFETASTVLQFHSGDWRAPFQTYKQWLDTWYKANPETRSILTNVFLCRRDYPIGGTGYLFNSITNQYTFASLIDESVEDLGGVDLIDISGWAYSEQYGRVGEYERYELGGRENLREGIAESRRRKVPTGLYFEGYLLDPRSEIGKQRGKEWQIVDANGQPKLWPGNQEMFICPLAPGWQEAMSGFLTRVARDTGADAVYMDEYGFGDAGKTCFSSEHGHAPGVHPVLAEHRMLAAVRASLDAAEHPPALYLEQTPNDVTSQYADAAFDYALWGESAYSSPAKLNLFRFAVPSFKIVQLFHPGIDPRAASEEDAKLCFFYGEAMWLKGRARSWYSREFREFVRQAYAVFHAQEEAFTSDDVEPMIPAEQPGLYANRFNTKTKSVVTLYNATPYTVRGHLLSISANEAIASTLWEGDEMEFRRIDGTQQVWGTIHPHDVSCFSLESGGN